MKQISSFFTITSHSSFGDKGQQLLFPSIAKVYPLLPTRFILLSLLSLFLCVSLWCIQTHIRHARLENGSPKCDCINETISAFFLFEPRLLVHTRPTCFFFPFLRNVTYVWVWVWVCLFHHLQVLFFFFFTVVVVAFIKSSNATRLVAAEFPVVSFFGGT